MGLRRRKGAGGRCKRESIGKRDPNIPINFRGASCSAKTRYFRLFCFFLSLIHICSLCHNYGCSANPPGGGSSAMIMIQWVTIHSVCDMFCSDVLIHTFCCHMFYCWYIFNAIYFVEICFVVLRFVVIHFLLRPYVHRLIILTICLGTCQML